MSLASGTDTQMSFHSKCLCGVKKTTIAINAIDAILAART
jgi:hypothetical protein